jgi:hypothetical protein
MTVAQTKTIFKYLIWTAALAAVSVGLVYAFWMVLISMLYDDQTKMIISGTVGLVLFGFYWKLLSIDV